ncbi:DUF3995 domain-containing protein [Oerskovia flava]|uniref:DUF3995 domain-containing protein n=1 Tax=Oerskovia flava TaxID=2986422 RepID=UPI0022405985|nr:DUF3995 domain-containing protein [Oerskovia sp. JB1-3-2]
MSRTLVWVAAALGGIHAGFSLYWALGGSWLLATVGRWAVEMTEDSPQLAAAALGAIALVKAVAAAVPVLVAYDRLPPRRLWRAGSWVGGTLLVAYGGVKVVVGGAVLAGVVPTDDGYDEVAMTGHTFLWDPLFVLWGAFLLASLWTSRRSTGARGIEGSRVVGR